MSYQSSAAESTEVLLARIRFKKALLSVINGETSELPNPRYFFLSRAHARLIIRQLISQIS
jgi:hypothetical protein